MNPSSATHQVAGEPSQRVLRNGTVALIHGPIGDEILRPGRDRLADLRAGRATISEVKNFRGGNDGGLDFHETASAKSHDSLLDQVLRSHGDASSPGTAVSSDHLNKSPVVNVLTQETDRSAGTSSSMVPLVPIGTAVPTIGADDGPLGDGKVSISPEFERSAPGSGTLVIPAAGAAATSEQMSDLLVAVAIAGAHAPVARNPGPAWAKPSQSPCASAVPRVQHSLPAVAVVVGSVAAIEAEIGLQVDFTTCNGLNGKGVVAAEGHLSRASQANLTEGEGANLVFPGLPLAVQIGVGGKYAVSMGSALD